MKIFPIYESCRLFKDPDLIQGYVCMFANDAYLIVSFVNGHPINIRWFEDVKEYNRFKSLIKKSFKHYDEYKEKYPKVVYPNPQEHQNVPF